jgi:hypothetical protein
LHYSKAKGGRHENQDERESWNQDHVQLMSHNEE